MAYALSSPDKVTRGVMTGFLFVGRKEDWSIYLVFPDLDEELSECPRLHEMFHNEVLIPAYLESRIDLQRQDQRFSQNCPPDWLAIRYMIEQHKRHPKPSLTEYRAVHFHLDPKRCDLDQMWQLIRKRIRDRALSKLKGAFLTLVYKSCVKVPSAETAQSAWNQAIQGEGGAMDMNYFDQHSMHTTGRPTPLSGNRLGVIVCGRGSLGEADRRDLTIT